MPIHNKNLQLKYLLNNDYIYKYNIKSSFLVPKVESISITLIHQNEKEIDFSLQDVQVKNILLFYSLLNKIPVTKIVPQKASRNVSQLDSKIIYVQKLLVKQKAYINKLLNFLFIGRNFNDFINDAVLTDNLQIKKTSIAIKYPLLAIYESLELNDEFDIAIKDTYFFIKITFDKILTKEKILNLHYFG